MAWNLAAGYVVSGVTAGTRDADIGAAMSIALNIAEMICDRPFLFQREIVRFYDRVSDHIQLPRWPVDQIFDTDGLQQSIKHVHRGAGRIYLHGQRPMDEVMVDYSGGYRQLPADLERALWDIFSTVWSQYYVAGTGGGGGPTIALGAVKRKTIVGVGSVEYETGSASSGNTAAADAGDLSDMVPGAALAILQFYKRYSA